MSSGRLRAEIFLLRRIEFFLGQLVCVHKELFCFQILIFYVVDNLHIYFCITRIANEDSASPMSDRRIAEAILIKGIAVSRRTIAKYREELGIPSSSDRRREKVK